MGFEDMMEGFMVGGAGVQFEVGAVWIPPAETAAFDGGVLGGREPVAP